ncbi:MAG: cytochrome c biogenesis protein ResB [Candidatus Omnitrophica bacterium]|nr:cytochrome c biogenesis protein ResB [Candidatus Omnitrophota bacterium]
MTIIKGLGSLKFAVVLIISLVLLLIVSTSMESAFGTPFAQKTFYQSRWFDLFLSLVWLNIFCSTLTRYPFKKHHTGFVITHIGILIVLAGALLTRLLGVEGQMMLVEGEHKHTIQQDGYVLNIASGGQPPAAVEIKNKKDSNPISVPLKDNPSHLLLHRTSEHLILTQGIAEGSEQDPSNHAIEAALHSDTVGLDQTFSLIEKNPEDPHSAAASIGPATLLLKTEQDPANPPRSRLRISKKGGEELFSIELTPEILARWQNSVSDEKITVPSSDLTLTNIRYLPNAKVDENNQLINAPQDIHFNPAIEFEIYDPQGQRERHTKFALFPDFDSLHGKTTGNLFDLSVALEIPIPESAQEPQPPYLIFSVSQKGEWTYRSLSSKGPSQEGIVSLNSPTSAGWMDITFTVTQIYHRAVISKQVVEDPHGTGGSFGAEISLIEEGTAAGQKQWVLLDQPAVFETKAGPLQLALTRKDLTLPFLLQLADFRKVDYPGTQNPSSFESDVTLYDMKEKTTIQKTISMNKPLDHAGFRIFQSSYIQDPSVGEASVFTIAKNPGITFIYSGAIILFTGVILLFYVKPLSREGNNNVE